VSDPARFYFDNHLPTVVVRELRRRGVDVVTAHDWGQARTPDPTALRRAAADGRVVVTGDEDFKVLAADFQARGEAFAGIVFCEQRKYLGRPGQLIQDLLILHGALTADDLRDRLEYL
jgi:hypothetical protein